MRGVAYVVVGSWNPSTFSVSDIDAVIDEFRDAPGMVIDVRPVIVLSGRGVFSSTESFSAAMRELPDVTILGDTTGGGTGNPGTYPLGDGWTYSVSRWIEWPADRRVIEWNGILPDTVVAWDPTAVREGRDPVLEAALTRLGAAAGARWQNVSLVTPSRRSS